MQGLRKLAFYILIINISIKIYFIGKNKGRTKNKLDDRFQQQRCMQQSREKKSQY